MESTSVAQATGRRRGMESGGGERAGTALGWAIPEWAGGRSPVVAQLGKRPCWCGRLTVNQSFIGSLDEPAVYLKALTAADAARHYKLGKP